MTSPRDPRRPRRPRDPDDGEGESDGSRPRRPRRGPKVKTAKVKYVFDKKGRALPVWYVPYTIRRGRNKGKTKYLNFNRIKRLGGKKEGSRKLSENMVIHYLPKITQVEENQLDQLEARTNQLRLRLSKIVEV